MHRFDLGKVPLALDEGTVFGLATVLATVSANFAVDCHLELDPRYALLGPIV